jgi:hypothetical protein
MSMIEFVEREVTLSHLNIRDEKHGEEPIVAVDVKLKVDLPNTLLDTLSDGLLLSMYAAEDVKGELFKDGHLPRLRYPSMDPIKFNLGETKVLLHFLRVTHDIELVGIVKKISAECKEGGTVTFVFSVASTPGSDVIGALSSMLGGDHSATIKCAASESPNTERSGKNDDQNEVDGEGDKPNKTKNKRGRGRQLPGVVH